MYHMIPSLIHQLKDKSYGLAWLPLALATWWSWMLRCFSQLMSKREMRLGNGTMMDSTQGKSLLSLPFSKLLKSSTPHLAPNWRTTWVAKALSCLVFYCLQQVILDLATFLIWNPPTIFITWPWLSVSWRVKVMSCSNSQDTRWLRKFTRMI